MTLVLIAFIASLFIDPTLRRSGSFPVRLPPGPEAMLGTTSLGQSVAIQLTEAIPNSVQVGLLAATVGTVIGVDRFCQRLLRALGGRDPAC
ncbi:MAG: hypothetical protein R2856_16740 [Caldilineaceae bacterium]